MTKNGPRDRRSNAEPGLGVSGRPFQSYASAMTESDPNLPAKPPAERVFVSPVGGTAAAGSDVGQKLAGVARIGFGALASTVRWMGWLGVVLAIAAGFIAGQSSALAGFIAAILALGITASVGFMLAWQRAGFLALADGLAASGLASSMFQSVFDRLMGDKSDEQGLIARTAGRIPLSQAQVRLTEAVERATPNVQAGGLLAGFFRKAHSSIVGTIRRLTLAEFRREDATGGGVDLVKVREHLSGRIESAIADGIRQRVSWLTIGYVIATTVVVLGLAWGLRELFR